MKVILNSTYKQKIKTKKNGNIWFKGSFMDGLLYLQKQDILGKDTDRIVTISTYARYIIFGERMLEFEIKGS